MASNNSPVTAHWETQQPQQSLYGRQIELHEDSGPDTLTVPHRSRSLYYHLVRFSVRLSEWWFPEILSFLIAGGLFGLHIYLLLIFDNQLVQTWDDLPLPNPFDTLQSLVSFLSTLMKGALCLPVTSAIGQWKWHQYRRKPQPLDELDRFDKASRGLTGSISFLLSEKIWNPASIGCVIIISGLFFGPFLQNTVRNEVFPKKLDNTPSFLQVAGSFDSHRWISERRDAPRLLVSSPEMQASVAHAWSYALSYDRRPILGPTYDIQPDCPPNITCDWEDWSTLALMRECEPADFEDSSGFSAATTVGTEREVVNSDGLRYNATTVLNMAASPEVPPTSAFLHRGWPILAHVGVVGFFNETEKLEAVECVLYWGVIRGSSGWRNGNITNEDIHDFHEPTQVSRAQSALKTDSTYDNITITAPWPCNFNTSTEADKDSTCDFTVAGVAQRGLWNTLYPYLNGYAKFSFDEYSGQNFFKGSNQAADLLLWDWIDDREKWDGSLFDVMNRQMQNIAIFASTTMRIISESPSFCEGTQSIEDLRFIARYRRLILPGTILAASIVFFVVTAVCTRGQGTWRNSQLPLLYHGLEKTGPREWQNVGATTMWEAACDTLVKLETEGVDRANGELKLHRYTDDNVRIVEPKGYSRVAVWDV